MKRKIIFFISFFLTICNYSYCQVNDDPKCLIIDGYEIMEWSQLAPTPEDGFDYSWTCVHMYIRKSDRRKGFCKRGTFETYCPPIFKDVYVTRPTPEYPLVAVKGENNLWGFYCIAFGGPSKVPIHFNYNLLYNCVFDEIYFETLDEPFKGGKARVKYKGKWITIDMVDDIINNAHGINSSVNDFTRLQRNLKNKKYK